MTAPRTLAICAFAVALAVHRVDAQDLSRYRDFALESDLAAVTTLTGAVSPETKTIHRRPALLQDMEWRPARWVSGSSLASTDPVEKIVFSFYEDQLFRLVIDYRPDRTEGMTNADMIEAIAVLYGAQATRPAGGVQIASQVEVESGSPIARWTDTERKVVLYRTSSYRQTFRLIVTALRLDTAATKAAAQAVRLDAQEAPRVELARQKQEQDDAAAAAAKARVTNKGIFRP